MTDERRSRGRSAGSGGSLVTILWIVFLILKLTHVIDWPWYWVFSPIWISIGLALVFFMIIGFILLLALVGVASASSGLVVGIKNWFIKQEATHEDTVDVQQDTTE